MRKIVSKEDEDKKRRRNQFVVGGILVLIMVLSTLGFALQGNSGSGNVEKVIYNNFEFVNQNGFWFLASGDTYFVFRNNPRQVSLGIPPITGLKPLNNYS